MGEEEKGFVVKDRRSLDEKGDLKTEQPEEKKPEGKPGKQEGKQQEPARDQEQRIPLPEVSFNSLIFSLSSSALLHLGEIQDPYTGQNKTDLPLAKHTIDLIALLKSKTKGNLTDEESKFLESVLADLRWRYVTAAEKA
ncbi:MAG: DUF1844 domain-containing protein [Deltaproteobacteria bacterium HGW-Deltaproteobacteria-21]|jgi:hypothetical protein|nr:MAG: DUF1844 domain-containing protein [Deltaproteobacteria bacterium HGW-Deltaproteobacteria-21]